MAAWPLPPAKRLVRGISYPDVSSNDSTFGCFSCARPLNRACLSPPPCAWHWTPRGSSCRNAPLLAVPSPAAPPVATPPFRRLLRRPPTVIWSGVRHRAVQGGVHVRGIAYERVSPSLRPFGLGRCSLAMAKNSRHRLKIRGSCRILRVKKRKKLRL